MKTILITCFHNHISRNILNTVLPHIVREQVRVVLVVPVAKLQYFADLFSGTSVFVEGVTVPKQWFDDWLYFLSLSTVDTHNHLVEDWKNEGRLIKFYLAHVVYFIASPFFFSHTVLRFLTDRYLRTTAFDAVFKTYKPDLVFSTDLFYREDRGAIAEARRHGITTVGMVRSWDNATTKGVLLVEPDSIIVPNKVLKDELCELHRVQQEKILVTGVPHYDIVITPPTETRDAFAKRAGLDPNKKIILFAPGGKILYRHDREMLLMLQKLLDTVPGLSDVQFLVRFPPGDQGDAARDVRADSRFAIDTPGTYVTGRTKEIEISQVDQAHLHNTLHICDAVLTLVSTIAIDAAVYTKPIAIISFDPVGATDDSVAKFAEYPHFKKFLGSGLLPIAHTTEELAKIIQTSITNPDGTTDARRELVRRYAHLLDGGASGRIAAHVMSMVSV